MSTPKPRFIHIDYAEAESKTAAVIIGDKESLDRLTNQEPIFTIPKVRGETEYYNHIDDQIK